MRTIVRLLAILSLAGAMPWIMAGSAVAQNQAETHPATPGASPPSHSGPGWAPDEEQAPAATPETATPGTELPVLHVTGVEILRATTQPELAIVRVTGLVSSEGWGEPELVPTYAGKPADGVLDLQMIATPPESSEDATGFAEVSAIFALEPGQNIKGVRVRGSDNAVAVKEIPGSAHQALHVEDCGNCVGKKFVPEGSAAQSQQGAIRQEDLPKQLRVIKATDGIRGGVRDPNRLTLILGDDNTILGAFWE